MLHRARPLARFQLGPGDPREDGPVDQRQLPGQLLRRDFAQWLEGRGPMATTAVVVIVVVVH